MVDYRPVCGKCFTRMRCIENGFKIRYSSGRIQTGDRYTCPTCGNSVVIGFGQPYIEKRTIILVNAQMVSG